MSSFVADPIFSGGTATAVAAPPTPIHYGDLVCLTCLNSELDQASSGYLICDGLISDRIECTAKRPSGAEANDAVFKICAPMSYEIQKVASLSRVASTAKSAMSLAIERQNMENRLNEELHKNEQKMNTHCGADHPLYHGQRIQLQHCKSGLFLSLEAQSVADQDAECMKVSLQEGSEASYFLVTGLYKIQIEGSPVFDDNQVQLMNVLLGDHYLHATWDKSKIKTSQIKTSEVNLSASVHMPWTVKLHRSHLHKVEKYFLIGQPVLIFHSEAEAYVMGTTSYGKRLKDAIRLNADSKSLKNDFVFESPNGERIEGGIVCWATPYRIRHIASDHFLAKGKDHPADSDSGSARRAPFFLVDNVDELDDPECTLFMIYPSQPGTEATGFIDWASVRVSGCRMACKVANVMYWMHKKQKQNDPETGRLITHLELCTERFEEDAIRVFEVEGTDIPDINYVLSCVKATGRYVFSMHMEKGEKQVQEVTNFAEMLGSLKEKLKGHATHGRLQDIARDLKLIDALMWAFQTAFGGCETTDDAVDTTTLPEIKKGIVKAIQSLIQYNKAGQTHLAYSSYETCWGFPFFNSKELANTLLREQIAHVRESRGGWVKALLARLKDRVGVGALLSTMIHDNVSVLQSSIDKGVLMSFIAFLKEAGAFPTWLDFFSECCICEGYRVPQLQESILRQFFSVRGFSGEFEEGAKFNRAQLTFETIQDHSGSEKTRYRPEADWAEFNEAIEKNQFIKNLKTIAVPKQHSSKYSQENKLERDGIVFFSVKNVSDMKPFRDDMKAGIAHLDRGHWFLGKHMYLEGFSRMLVGFSRKTKAGSIFLDSLNELYHCPGVEVDASMKSVVTTLVEDGGYEPVRQASTHSVDSYFKSTSSGSSSDMVWFKLEHLLCVLEPGRLFPLVFPGRRVPDMVTITEENRAKFKKQVLLAQYYEAQIRLMSSLCFDNNARCISVVQKMFPFELVLVGMTNELLPASVRNAFVQLMINAHVVAHPHTTLHVPNTIRLYNDLANDFILSNENALPRTEPHLMCRLRLLKFFTSDYFLKLLESKSSTKSESEHQLSLAVTQLCRSMAEHGFYGTVQGIRYYLCGPLLSVIDGRRAANLVALEDDDGAERSDGEDDDDGTRQGDGVGASPEERYADNEATATLTQSKIESCKVMLQITAIRLDYQLSKLLHGWRFLAENSGTLTPGHFGGSAKVVPGEILSAADDAIALRPGASQMFRREEKSLGRGSSMKRLRMDQYTIAKMNTAGSQVLRKMPWVSELSVTEGTEQLFEGLFSNFFHTADPTAATLDFELMTNAPFTTICLDLLMYESKELFDHAMTLLIRKFSTRAALRDTLPVMQILVMPERMADYTNISRHLQYLKHCMNSFPVWAMGNYPQMSPKAQIAERDKIANKVIDIMKRLISLVGLDEATGARSKGHQDLMRHCNAHKFALHALRIRARVKNDTDNKKRKQRIDKHNELLESVHTLCYEFLRVMVIQHTANQKILYQHLDFMIGRVDDAEHASMASTILNTIGAIFQGNADLATSVPQRLLLQLCGLTNQAMTLQRNANIGGGGSSVGNYLRFFLGICVVDGKPIKSNQQHLIQLFVDFDFDCFMIWARHDERAKLMQDFIKSSSADTLAQARVDEPSKHGALQYHVQLLELFVAINQSASVQVHARMQGLLPAKHLLSAISEPAIIPPVMMLLCQLLKAVYFDSQLVDKHLEKPKIFIDLVGQWCRHINEFNTNTGMPKASKIEKQNMIFGGIIPCCMAYLNDFYGILDHMKVQQARVDMLDSLKPLRKKAESIGKTEQELLQKLVDGLDKRTLIDMNAGFFPLRRESVIDKVTLQQSQLQQFTDVIFASRFIQQKIDEEFDELVKAVETVERRTDPHDEKYNNLKKAERNRDPRCNMIAFDDLITKIVRNLNELVTDINESEKPAVNKTTEGMFKLLRRLVERKLDNPTGEDMGSLLDPILPVSCRMDKPDFFPVWLTTDEEEANMKRQILTWIDSFPVLMGIIALVLLSFFLSSSKSIESDLGDDGVAAMNAAFAAVFLFEVLTRLWCVGFRKYVTDPMCFVDGAVSTVDVVFVLGGVFEIAGLDPSQGSAARVGRMLRMVRLVRLSRTLRFLEGIHRMLYGKSVEQKRISDSRDEHEGMQRKMCELGVLELVVRAFESKSLPAEMRLHVARLGYRLLEYGNTVAQDKLLQVFSSRSASTLFDNTMQLMQEAADECIQLRSQTAEEQAASTKEKHTQDSQRYELVCVTLRFLQSSCEGHHAAVQDFLREQPRMMRSINMVEHAGLMLCQVAGDETVMETKLGFPELKLMDSILVFLIEAVQGPNRGNQKVLAEGPVVSTMCRLLNSRLKGVKDVSSRNSSGLREKQAGHHKNGFTDLLTAQDDPLAFVYSAKQLKIRCVELLVALVEGLTNQETIDRLSDSIDTTVLRKRINETFLLHYYLQRNEVPDMEKQLILNAESDEWTEEFLREGDLLMIVLKTLSEYNASFAARSAVNADELTNDREYFYDHYDAAVADFYMLKEQRDKFTYGDAKEVKDPDKLFDIPRARASDDQSQSKVQSEARLRGIFKAGANVLRLFGAPHAKHFRMISKRKRLLQTKWRDEYDSMWARCRKAHQQAVEARAFFFFEDRIRSVEICWDGHLHKLFFPLPDEMQYLTDFRASLLTDVDTSTSEDKLRQFMSRCKTQSATMPYNIALDHFKIPGAGVSMYDVIGMLDALDCISFAVAVVNAFVMMISLEHAEGVLKDGEVVYHYKWCQDLNESLGIAQLVLCVLVAFFYLLKRFPFVVLKRFQTYLSQEKVTMLSVYKEFFNMCKATMPPVIAAALVMVLFGLLLYWRYEATYLLVAAAVITGPYLLVEVKKYFNRPASYGTLVFVTVLDLFGDPTTMFNFALVVACVLGLWKWEFFYSMVLFKAITLSPSIANVVKAVYIPAKSLGLTFVLAVIVVYVFALWGFWVFPELFVVEDEEFCRTMSECFWFVLHMGFLSGAGIPGDGIISESDHSYNTYQSNMKMAFDLAFWVVVTICIVNMVFGIMIDTFAALREETEQTNDKLDNHCFICCLHRSVFLTQHGFEEHQKIEHNMLNYVYFITYVECTKETLRNGYQDYVHDMLEEGDVAWLPLNKSLVLNIDGEEATLDSVNGAIEDLGSKLDSVVTMMGDIQGRLTSLENSHSTE